jgi:hypothetical protein
MLSVRRNHKPWRHGGHDSPDRAESPFYTEDKCRPFTICCPIMASLLATLSPSKLHCATDLRWGWHC